MRIEYIRVVIAIITNKEGLVLVEKNKTQTKFNGFLQFPGGKVEKGESLYNALKRELNEELGITIAEEDIEPFFFQDYITNNKHVILFFYLCKNYANNISNKENQELNWLNISDLITAKNIAHNKGAIEKLHKYLKNNQN